MTKFTKEQLIEWAKDCRMLAQCAVDARPDDAAAAKNLALAEITLAALTAPTEPVYQYRIRNGYNGQVTEWQTIRRDQVDFVLKAQPHNAEFQIITTPAPQLPQPAVADDFESSRQKFELWVAENYDSRLKRSGNGYSGQVLNQMWQCWNACRAAMLQGKAETVSQPCTLPDGMVAVPVELTGDMTNAMTEAILDDLHNVDVWRSVLAAAPQQEVK